MISPSNGTSLLCTPYVTVDKSVNLTSGVKVSCKLTLKELAFLRQTLKWMNETYFGAVGQRGLDWIFTRSWWVSGSLTFNWYHFKWAKRKQNFYRLLRSDRLGKFLDCSELGVDRIISACSYIREIWRRNQIYEAKWGSNFVAWWSNFK